MRELLRQLIADSLGTPAPPYTRRDVHLPAVPCKAVAVVGMRRSGKTTFLWQCMADAHFVGCHPATTGSSGTTALAVGGGLVVGL